MIVKPKTRKGKKVLEEREPKLIENEKVALFLKGGKCSQEVSQILKDLYMMKKPLAIMYSKKNFTRPFEDTTSLEFFAKKCDTSLFMFGCHSKKRPKNVIIGRTYDHHVLDMVEFGVDNFVSIKDFEAVSKLSMGTKPVLLFHGELFEQDDEMLRIKSLLTDFFKGPTIEKLSVGGLEHVISFTAIPGKVILRSYRAELKKSSHRVPYVDLKEIGPALDLTIRRKHMASDDLFKKSCKKPKEVQPKKTKNINHDAFGSRLGRIHMQTQDISNMPVRRVKALRNVKKRPATSKDAHPSSETQAAGNGTPTDSNSQLSNTKDNASPKSLAPASKPPAAKRQKTT